MRIKMNEIEKLGLGLIIIGSPLAIAPSSISRFIGACVCIIGSVLFLLFKD